MAQFISVRNDRRRTYDLEPKDGKRFSQEEVRALFLSVPDRAERGGKAIFVESANLNLRFNLLATLAIEDRNVYGNALICDIKEAPI